MSQSGLKRHTVLSVRFLCSDAFVVRTERNGLSFIPGQHVTLGLQNAGINREYSIYSAVEDDFLEFLVKIHPGSDSAAALGAARQGDVLILAGPYGAFHLPQHRTPERSVLFFAGGVGIAPFRSIIRSTPGLDYRLIHGIRKIEDAYDREDYDSSRYITCTSRDTAGDYQGRVTGWLSHNSIPATALVYICGSANMVAETYDCLRNQGLPSDSLHTEVFF